LGIQEYQLVSHQYGKTLSFPILTIVPDEVSFAEVPSADQTGKQPFHESLLLVLGKRGLTASIDYGWLRFRFEPGDEGANKVEVFFIGGKDATFWL
jgi:hypothetical protein